MRRGRNLWKVYLASGLVLTVALPFVPAGGDVWLAISLVVCSSMVAALILGLRINRPDHPMGWWILTAGAVLHLVADALWYPSQAGRLSLPFPSIADGFYLTSYVTILVGLALFVRSRTAGRDRAAFIDALLVTGGMAVLSWVFVMERLWDDSALLGPAKLVSIAYPLVDLLLLSAVLRLAFVSRTKDRASMLLSLYIIAQLAADTIYGITQLNQSFTTHSAAFAAYLISYILLGTAALHPLMGVVTQQIPADKRASERWRLPVIILAALIPPGALIVMGERGHSLAAIAVISAGLFVLAMFRPSRQIVDLSEFRRTKAHLQQAEDQYLTLVEQLPMVVYRAEFGEGGAWSYVSPQVESLMGYPREDWIADPRFWYEHILSEDRERVLRDEAHSSETGEPFASEYRMAGRDGRILWLRDEAEVLRDEDGTRSSIQGVMVDITESKRANEAIERLNEELEQRVAERTADLETANVSLREAKEVSERANAAKSEFLSRMSHELRTPLNAILGFGQLMETSALAPDDVESVEQILKGGRHLLGLINEVLDISRIESSRLSLSIEPVSVNEVVHETIDLVAPLCTDRGIEVVATISQPSPFVLADHQRLKQVLLNLLSNAIKYNRTQGRVDVSCEAEGNDRIAIRVTDTGPGFPLEDLDRLFAPFDRLGAEKTGAEGTGLGLALSKALIESMAGRIVVESEQGLGSTFTVELPACREPGWDVDGSEKDQVPGPSGSSRLRTILYVENNLANVSLVERILLQRPSVKLVAAMQARLGLELAREHSPALVLLDLHLPDLSGEEALERLRQDPMTRHIPVVIMSADSTPGQINRLRAMGIDDYVTKPIDVTRFLEVVDRALAVRSDSAAGVDPISALG
ncbi:MAG: ATP-binding protein [Actinomycetota bacterium]|nr:ATP-binding protein [Actinomycetota bacterium]